MLPGRPGAKVLERIGGRWETAFAFTDGELARMNLREVDCSVGGTTGFFTALAVTDSSSTGSAQTVVVAMGRQGVLRLDPETGRWDRIAVGNLEPVSTSGPRWLRWFLLSPALVIVLSPVLFFVNRRRVSSARRLGAVALGGGSGAMLLLLVLGLFLLTLGTFEYQAFSIFFAAASVVAFLVSLAVVLPRSRPPARPGPTPEAEGPPSAVGGGQSRQ